MTDDKFMIVDERLTSILKIDDRFDRSVRGGWKIDKPGMTNEMTGC